MSKLRLKAGEVIRRYREEEARMTVPEAVKQAQRIRKEWRKGTWYKYENNQLSVTLSIIDEMAEAMGLDPAVIALSCIQTHFSDREKTRAVELLENVLEQLSTDLGEPNGTSQS